MVPNQFLCAIRVPPARFWRPHSCLDDILCCSKHGRVVLTARYLQESCCGCSLTQYLLANTRFSQGNCLLSIVVLRIINMTMEFHAFLIRSLGVTFEFCHVSLLILRNSISRPQKYQTQHNDLLTFCTGCCLWRMLWFPSVPLVLEATN